MSISNDRVEAFQRGWASVPQGAPGDRTRAGIAALDAHDDQRRPAVCARCYRRFDTPDLQHRANGDGSGDVCVWPCNHEVQEVEPRCLYCRPLTELELNEPPF